MSAIAGIDALLPLTAECAQHSRYIAHCVHARKRALAFLGTVENGRAAPFDARPTQAPTRAAIAYFSYQTGRNA